MLKYFRIVGQRTWGEWRKETAAGRKWLPAVNVQTFEIFKKTS